MKRICSICEAGCGLEVSTDGRTVTGIKANQDDVFSEGHVCAKGLSLKELDADPDRLRQPLLRQDGELRPASWDEALDFIATRLQAIKLENAPDAVASYIGNPTAHNIGLSLGLGVLLGSFKSKNVYSAASVDQLPKQLASFLMFGDGDAVPVPDITETDCLLMLGANPVVSNGSLWMVPGFRNKLRDLQDRGGKLITVDPRLTETARLADDHYFIRPGTDAYLLAAIANELIAEGLTPATSVPIRGWNQLKEALGSVSTKTAAEHCGVCEDDIRSLATQLAEAQSPVVYGRIGTTLQKYGTLTSFLIEVVNLLLGALDRKGGAMFPEQPFASAKSATGGAAYNRWCSRVSQFPEVLGQLPCAALAEEIETPGEGQIRALFCLAGNPLVSNPDSDRLEAALKTLDLLVCIDIYHNETTQYADVVLPGTSPFEDGHYDQFLGSMGWRNSARYSPPLFETEGKREWDIGLNLAYIANHGKPPSDHELADFEDTVIAGAATQYTVDPTSPLFERDVQELVASVGPESGVERLLDLGIRAGRWGDHFGKTDGLTLQKMIDEPDGIDLGELRSGRLKELVTLPGGNIELSPEVILEDLKQLADQAAESGFLLIGRRQASTNNSWLGNLPMLTKGKSPCFLEVHAEDAAELGLQEGRQVEISSETGSLMADVVISNEIMRGCVCLPHGFSEARTLLQQVRRTGPNYNRLAAASSTDRPSGTAALNGIRVDLAVAG